MPDGHLAAPVAAREVEREPNDPPRSRDADRLHRDAGVFADGKPAERRERLAEPVECLAAALELDPRVEVLGVLADDDEIDVRIARLDAG